jgi:hypothetical protein
LQKRDELTAQAQPPQALFDLALTDPEAVRLGAGLNQTFAAALRLGRERGENPLERAKAAVGEYLSCFPPERHGGILLGALASVYGKDAGGADTAVWLADVSDEEGSKQPGTGPSSVASLTIAALREVGILDDIVSTRAGLVVYPTEMNAKR